MKAILTFQLEVISPIILGFFNNKEMEDVLINITSWKKSVTIDELSFKEKIDQIILLVENDLEH